jgi:hypothetical protein
VAPHTFLPECPLRCNKKCKYMEYALGGAGSGQCSLPDVIFVRWNQCAHERAYMRVCQWSTQEALRFRRIGVKPSCGSHSHLLSRDAEALIALGMAEWVGRKQRAVTPTPRSTDRGYDNAPRMRPPTKTLPSELGVCKVCGAGSFLRVCNRCQLDGIDDRYSHLIPTQNRWEHVLDGSNRVPENV